MQLGKAVIQCKLVKGHLMSLDCLVSSPNSQDHHHPPRFQNNGRSVHSASPHVPKLPPISGCSLAQAANGRGL